MSPLEVLFLIALGTGTVWGFASGRAVDRFLSLVAGYLVALIVVSAIVIVITRMPWPLGRTLATLQLTFVVYGSLTPLLAGLESKAIDRTLHEMEAMILGRTLVEAVAPFASLGGTIFWGVIYALHIPLFLLPAWLHWQAGRCAAAEKLALAQGLAMYCGFIGYAVWPALGPVGALPGLPPLPDNEITRFVAQQGIALGTFPSLHAGISAIVAIDGWRTSRRWAIVTTIVAALIWGSTIYLRYHWLPDLVAGLVLAIISVWVAGRLYAAWPAIVRWRPRALASHRRRRREADAFG